MPQNVTEICQNARDKRDRLQGQVIRTKHKISKGIWVRRLTPVTLATCKTEIGRAEVPGQPRQKSS
jgi:hypothetical protein